MSKRKRFVTTSLALSLGFVGVQLLPDHFRLLGIALLGLLTLGLFIWALKEGLDLDHTLLTLSLPVFYTVGVGLFWFLLPASIYARIPIVIFYGIGIYALCLTANIYTVAAIRTIALLRAARGVGFVLTLVTFFLIFDAILSLRAGIFLTSIGVAVSSLLLFYQGFWSIVLEKNFSRKVLRISLVSSFVIGEVAVSIYFWPVTVVVGSLFLTVACYMVLGLGQSKLEGRLFQQTIREYLLVGVLVFLGMFLATRWAG